jgi:hypothetical protein
MLFGERSIEREGSGEGAVIAIPNPGTYRFQE